VHRWHGPFACTALNQLEEQPRELHAQSLLVGKLVHPAAGYSMAGQGANETADLRHIRSRVCFGTGW